MSKRVRRKRKRGNSLTFEVLESRRYLASVGWDGAGQGSVELTYFIGEVAAGVDQSAFEAVVEDALEVWSDVVDIVFTQTYTAGLDNSLDITFGTIDGSGGALAQAYFPDDVNRSTVAGDIEFDSAEVWEIGNDSGQLATDLLYVAVHEIGHAIGLDHSSIAASVMFGSVSPNTQFTGLDNADIASALSLYAPAEEASTDGGTDPNDRPDSDGGTGTDTGPGTDSGTNTDGGPGTDNGAGTDAGTDTHGGTDTDNGKGTDSGTDSDGGADTDGGTSTDAGTETDGGTDTDSGTETDGGTDTDSETETDDKTDTDHRPRRHHHQRRWGNFFGFRRGHHFRSNPVDHGTTESTDSDTDVVHESHEHPSVARGTRMFGIRWRYSRHR